MGGEQVVDDLAYDLRDTDFIEKTRAFGAQAMERYNSNELVTVPCSAPWSPVVALATNDIPVFIKSRWAVVPDYEICLSNGIADKFVIDWGSHGIVIGTNAWEVKRSRWSGHYFVQLQPSVYIIWYDDK